MRDLLAKRLFDIFFSLFGIIISLPLWLIISILIYAEDKGSIYYLQDRIGKDGRIFKIIKFRSMMPNAECSTGPIQAMENDERMTNIGNILRKTAMDELPQLLNILGGSMSFVGPRALRSSEIESETKTLTDLPHHPDIKIRNSVTPGLTGVAQIFAPCDATVSKKFIYDIWYIKHRKLTTDIWLIFVSFLITFRARWETRKEKLYFLKFSI